ncbi:glycosyltransferase [Luteimonas viscosa]|nr:glycosyltransferase [Luteimonas viscosa]
MFAPPLATVDQAPAAPSSTLPAIASDSGFSVSRPRRWLLIDVAVPRPDRDSGSLRAYNLIRLLRAEGDAVEFLPDRREEAGGYAEALREMGVVVHQGRDRAPYPQWFAHHLARFDMLVISRYHLAEFLTPLARRVAPETCVILDTVDLHHLREQREAELRDDSTLRRLARSTRRRELAAVSAAHVVWVVSHVERDLLQRALPGVRVEVLPNIHEAVATSAGFGSRQGLLFIGGARHPPNVDAVDWLLGEIFPRIRLTLPDCALHLVGEGLSRLPSVRRAGPGVVVHDHVPRLEPLLDACRVGLAPLRYGAGVKGKMNICMAHGMPVVATTCAAEGMHLEHDGDVLLADDADALATAAIRAYQDQALWQRLSANGLRHVQQHFSFDVARRALAATCAVGR